MQWILDNWVLILLGGGMIAMHLRGHGSKGHGGGGCCGGKSKPKPEEDSEPTLQPDPDSKG